MLLPRPSKFEYCFVDSEQRRQIRSRVLKKIHHQKIEKHTQSLLWKLGERLTSSEAQKNKKVHFLWVSGTFLFFLMGLFFKSLFSNPFKGWFGLGWLFISVITSLILMKKAKSRYHFNLDKQLNPKKEDASQEVSLSCFYFQENTSMKAMKASKAALEDPNSIPIA